MSGDIGAQELLCSRRNRRIIRSSLFPQPLSVFESMQSSEPSKLFSSSADPLMQGDIFRLLVSSVRDYAIFVLDPTGIIMTWNEGAQNIKGYSAEDIIGKHFSTFYEKEAVDRGHPQFELEEAKKHGSYEEAGWRIRKDGRRFWANVVITAIYEKEKLVGFAKVTRDLTERKQAEIEREEALKGSELFRLLVNGVKDYAIFVLDPNGLISTWNVGAQRIKGYRADEVIGKHFSIFYTPDAIALKHPARELEIAGKTGRYEEEGWRVRKDGTRFWANVVITSLIQDGKLVGFAKVTRDLTERKQAEQQAQFRLIAESVPQALFTANSGGICDYFNQRWLDGTGLTMAQSLNEGWIAAVHPADRDAVWRCWQEHLNSGEPVEIEFRCNTKEGPRWTLFRANALSTDDKVDKWIGTLTDIHEKRAYREELERQIGERTRELRKAHDEAVAASEAKSRFLSTVSHEVRTPMAGIIGLVELILVTSSDPDIKSLSQNALESSQRLLRILNDLLDASKLQAGKLRLEYRKFSIRPLIGDVIQLVRAEADKKNLSVVSGSAEDVPQYICGDELRIRQILLNLAFNAVKFTYEGRIEIDTTIFKKDDGTELLEFSVKDTGIGINPSQKEKLFEAFVQGDDSTTRIFGGTGLGLNICRTLVQLMHGEIGVDSEPGKGSRFWVHIPFGDELCQKS